MKICNRTRFQLEQMANLFEQNPDCRLFYTTSDDGVYLSFNFPDRDGDQEIYLGFGTVEAGQSIKNFLNQND